MSSLPTNRLLRKQLGAWYTSAEIVKRLLVEWAIRSPIERVLDPYIGDGHFLVEAPGRLRVLGALGLGAQLHGADLNPNAVDEIHRALVRAQPSESPVDLRVKDFFAIDPPEVDAVVGNPPYVRYQSFIGARRARALGRARWAGVGLTGLSSSWDFSRFCTMGVSWMALACGSRATCASPLSETGGRSDAGQYQPSILWYSQWGSTF